MSRSRSAKTTTGRPPLSGSTTATVSLSLSLDFPFPLPPLSAETGETASPASSRAATSERSMRDLLRRLSQGSGGSGAGPGGRPGAGRARDELQAQRALQGSGQELEPPPRRPLLEAGVAFHLAAQAEPAAVLAHGERLDHRAVATVQGVGQAQEAGEDAHRAALLAGQGGEDRILLAGHALAVIAAHQGQDLDVHGMEAAEVSVADEVERVL